MFPLGIRVDAFLQEELNEGFPSALEPNHHRIMVVESMLNNGLGVRWMMIWEKLELPGLPVLFIFMIYSYSLSNKMNCDFKCFILRK